MRLLSKLAQRLGFTPRQQTRVHAPMPIVVGAARSGTTLLRVMLDSHPELAIPPETGFIPSLAALAARGDELRRQFVDTVVRYPNWNYFGFSADDLDRGLRQVRPFTLSDGIRCFYRMYAERLGKLRWGDKTPPYCEHLITLERLLPEARFIHMIRDGRDVALSLRGLWFSPGDDMTTLARYWVQSVSAAREQGEHCRRYLEVRYEDLIMNAPQVLQRICDFIDLPYDPMMLRYHERAQGYLDDLQTRRSADGKLLASAEHLRKHWRLISQPPQASRIGRWRGEMTSAERAQFEAVAQATLSELGYRAA
jgi:hypothetical protein